jgi:predicted dinucleotide-binding enzyme
MLRKLFFDKDDVAGTKMESDLRYSDGIAAARTMIALEGKLKGGAKPVMFVAGEGAGKPKVLQLVADLGFEAIDVGGLECARLLEPLALLWIHLALVRGLGREFAFGLLRK